MLTFVKKWKDANYKSHWNILVLCDQQKMMSDLNLPKRKMFDFGSFPLIGCTLVIKLRKFDFENYGSSLILFDKKKYITLDLNVSHGKMANFVSFLLFGLTLVIKLGNFDFKFYRNTLILFDQKPKKKKKILDLIVPCQPVSDLV